MMKPKHLAMHLLVLAGFCGLVYARDLTQKQAEELVLNIPRVVSSKTRGGCPKVSVNWVNEKQSTIFFSVHDPCDKSGSVSDKIGQFTVDLKNGEVWLDV